MKFCITLLVALAVLSAVPAAFAADVSAPQSVGVRAGVAQDSGAGDVTVRPVAGGVEIAVSSDEPVEVTVWDITGQAVVRVSAASSAVTRIDLPRGCYIVRAGTVTKRIAVG